MFAYNVCSHMLSVCYVNAATSPFWQAIREIRDPGLQDLAAKLSTVIWADVAVSTRCNYLRAFERWRSWASSSTLPFFPVNPAHLALYLVSLLQRDTTAAPVTQCVSALRWIHLKAGHTDPTSHPVVRQLVEAARRVCAQPVSRRTPLSPDLYRRLLSVLVQADSSLGDLQLASLVSLGYVTLLRWDELHRLSVDDIAFHASHASVHLRSRKNDQLRHGDVVLMARQPERGDLCPVAILHRFVKKANHASGQPLFGKLTSASKGPGVRGSMTYSRARELFLQCLQRIGVQSEGYGLHSLRSGGATAAANAGVADRLLQRHGGWRSVSSKDKYILDSKEAMLSVSAAILTE